MNPSPQLVLFHGTTELKAKSIFQNRLLRHNNIQRAYDSEHLFPTTDNFLYLTDSFNFAVYCSNRVAVSSEEGESKKLYIFKCLVPESILEADLDEIMYTSLNEQEVPPLTTHQSLNLYHSARVAQSLSLGREVLEYAVLPTAVEYSHQLNSITQMCISSSKRTQLVIAEEIEWIQIEQND